MSIQIGAMKRSNIITILLQAITTVVSLLLLSTSYVFAQGADDEWDILIEEARELYGAGQLDRAEVVAKKALDLAEKNIERGPDVATSLDNLATVYLLQDQYGQAEPLLKRALAIKTKALGPDHPDVAWSLNALAVIYYFQGQYAQAEEPFKRSLAIWENAFGPDHPTVARSLNLLAELYRAMNRDEEAEKLEQRAATLLQKPAEIFVESLMSKLVPGEDRKTLEQGLESGKDLAFHLYQSGTGICRALNSGSTKEEILDASYYHYWGVAVSDAMYGAALEVLCPELSAPGPDKLPK